MELFLMLGLPVICIVGFLRLFKFKWPNALIIIFVFAAVSTFAVDFTYCEILKTKCEPDALNAVGYLFHWLIVTAISSALDFSIFKLLAKEVESHAS